MGALTITREGEVAVVTFDLPGESVNKFSRKVKDEFAKTMTTLRADQTVKAVVDRKSTRLNSSHIQKSRMPSSA